jgi:hypothetical protein
VTPQQDAAPEAKIGPEFRARLEQLRPDQKVRAVLLLSPPQADGAGGRRQSRAGRKAALQSLRDAAERRFEDLDAILARHDGRRLQAHASAIGTVPVETTAAGIRALARSDHVRAIFEDQSISLLAPSLPASPTQGYGG